MLRVSARLTTRETASLLALAKREDREPQAQAKAMILAALEAAGLEVGPAEPVRGIGWDDAQLSSGNGHRLIISLPEDLARQLAAAATRESRTTRQQALHELRRALSAGRRS